MKKEKFYKYIMYTRGEKNIKKNEYITKLQQNYFRDRKRERE